MCQLHMNPSCTSPYPYLLLWKGNYVSVSSRGASPISGHEHLFSFSLTIAGITYVPLEAGPVVKILLTMNKQDKVRHLREAIIDLRLKEGFHLDKGVTIVLAEVFDHHIAKFLVSLGFILLF